MLPLLPRVGSLALAAPAVLLAGVLAIGCGGGVSAQGLSGAPPLGGPLPRTVGDVHAALSAYYLEPSRVPGDPGAFATVEDLLAALGDPFTFELTPAQVAAVDQGAEAGKGFGIARVGTLVYVSTVDPGGPAWREGLRRNDVLTRVDGVPIDETTTDAALVSALAADPLDLEVTRAGVPFAFRIAAEAFTTVTVEETSLDADTHYVRIDAFPRVSADPRGPPGELEAVLLANPTKSRWVLDLRWNPGGSVGRAAEVVDLFVSGGTIVELTQRDDVLAYAAAASPGHTGEGREVVVLLNSGSASSAEIVASALHELQGAPLVGEESFGKGVAQIPFDYTTGGRLNMVTHRVLGPGGATWHLTGLTPDMAVPLDPDQLLTGVDSQLAAALSAFTGATSTLAPARAAETLDPAVVVPPERLIDFE